MMPSTMGIVGVDLEMRQGPFGWQLHALRPFAQGEAVALYSGYLMSCADAKKVPISDTDHFRSHVALQWIIDGARDAAGALVTQDPNHSLAGKMGGAAFANDARGQTGKENNVHFDFWEPAGPFNPRPNPQMRMTLLIADRSIAAGEEILVSYGNDYWARRAH